MACTRPYMETREIIEECIRANPGISFSELKRETGLANGVLQYHIRKSDAVVRQKKGLLPEEFCDDCSYSSRCQEICLMRELRKKTNREILRGMEEGRTQSEIAEKLDKDRSTISYHVSRLEELGLIEDGEPVEEAEL
ncbi:MAG: winged helix-turn-helix transcriptional regulator [Candidatus Nanohaloarchaea archaeon]